MNVPTPKTRASRDDDSVFNRLSMRTRATLKSLLESPLATEAIQQVESEHLVKRRALGDELNRLDADYPRELPRLEKTNAAAIAALAEAEAAHLAAKAALAAAQQAAYAHEISYRARRKALIGELTEGADSRLADFIFHAGNVMTAKLPLALQSWPDPAKQRALLFPASSSNIEQYRAAKAALQHAIDQAEAMRLRPLSFAEVSRELQALCAGMAPTLAPLELNPPALIGPDFEPGPDLLWSGNSRWRLDEVVTPDPSAEAAVRRTKLAKA